MPDPETEFAQIPGDPPKGALVADPGASGGGIWAKMKP
ncbi:MAG: hypothetical protein RIR14_1939 [Pseudomonadota bacterium]